MREGEEMHVSRRGKSVACALQYAYKSIKNILLHSKSSTSPNCRRRGGKGMGRLESADRHADAPARRRGKIEKSHLSPTHLWGEAFAFRIVLLTSESDDSTLVMNCGELPL